LIVVRPDTWTWQSASRQAARFVPSFAFGGGVALGAGFGVGVGAGVGVALGVADEAVGAGAALGVPESSLEPQAVRSSAAANVAVITFIVAIVPQLTSPLTGWHLPASGLRTPGFSSSGRLRGDVDIS
jgi:hypothetical protein